MQNTLTGKVALVTGASRGIGRAIALKLAAEGAAVVINYHGSMEKAKEVKAEIESDGGIAEIMQCNVADYQATEAMIRKVTDDFGRLDILVNKEEVDALMKLLHSYLKDCLKTSKKNNMQVRVIGDISKLDKDLQERIIELERVSAENTGLHFQVALNYGSRDEMIRAMRKMTKDCADGRFAPEEITEELFEGYLDTHGIPDPDLLIRTSGELRLSNYLLWQLAYTEFYFTDVPWPDFSKEELEKAIEQYNSRDRRYGGIKEDEENV